MIKDIETAVYRGVMKAFLTLAGLCLAVFLFLWAARSCETMSLEAEALRSSTVQASLAMQFGNLSLYAADNDGRLPPSYCWQEAISVYGRKCENRRGISVGFNRVLSTREIDSVEEKDSTVSLFETADRSAARNTAGGPELLPRNRQSHIILLSGTLTLSNHPSRPKLIWVPSFKGASSSL